MAGEVVVDALPYVDQGYEEPGVKEAALSLIEEETKRYRPTKNYLEHLPVPNYHAYETEVMKTESERLKARLPMEMLSMKRYELPQPSAGQMTDVTAWNDCVNNSQAQLEHQALRIANLELLKEYGSAAWKSYNDLLVQMVEQAQRQLSEIRKNVTEVNWERKSEQIAAGEKLKRLEESWVGLVSKNYEIEQAIVELDKELRKSEKRRERKKRKK